MIATRLLRRCEVRAKTLGLFAFVCLISARPAHSQTALTGFDDAPDGQQHVFYIGANQHVYHTYSGNDGASWTLEDLTGLTGPLASPGSALASFESAVDHQQHVFYLGSNQHVYQFYFGGGWLSEDVTASAGAPLAAIGSALTGFEDVPDDQQHVFYLGANQHIYHMYFAWNPPGWSLEDLTGFTGGALASPGSALVSFEAAADNQQHVFYFGSDQHVYQFYHAGSWYPQDITASVTAPLAAVGSALTGFEDVPDDQQDVFYIGPNQHIYRLYFTWNPAGWNLQDLTGSTSAALAATGTALASFQGSNQQQHVFYVGIDRHLHQLYSSPGGAEWTVDDITADCSGPAALAGPIVSFEDPSNGDQHVLYVDTNLNVEHVVWTSTAGWLKDDITTEVTGPLVALPFVTKEYIYLGSRIIATGDH